jgi:DNA-binding response OmpR family regulator
MSQILLVDTDATRLRALEDIVRAAGFEFSAVRNGSRALALAIAAAFDYDAIVTEHLLFCCNGAVLASKARADGIKIPIIVLSGEPGVEPHYAGLDVRILYRPTQPRELIAALEQEIALQV